MLETGSHAAHGAGTYVLQTRAGQDSILYDRLDNMINELASLHGVSEPHSFIPVIIILIALIQPTYQYCLSTF